MYVHANAGQLLLSHSYARCYIESGRGQYASIELLATNGYFLLNSKCTYIRRPLVNVCVRGVFMGYKSLPTSFCSPLVAMLLEFPSSFPYNHCLQYSLVALAVSHIANTMSLAITITSQPIVEVASYNTYIR